jgi:hypothetical protein
MITLTAARNGIVWRLYLEGPTEDPKPIAEVSQLPVPRVGDTISHEDLNGPLTVTRITWNLRADYPLEADVYAQ